MEINIVPSETINFLVSEIRDIIPKSKTKLIAIDGRGGSGKSTLAKLLCEALIFSQVISMDDFPSRADEHPFHPLGTQTIINWKRVLDEVILPLSKGEISEFSKSPWWERDVMNIEEKKKAYPFKTSIIEGVTSLRYELRNFFDLKIWIECDPEFGARRGIIRDGVNDFISWREAYIPQEKSYVELHKPHQAADIIILNNGEKNFSVLK